MTVQHLSPKLSLLLEHTAKVLQDVESGQSMTERLSTVPSNLRPGVQALSFHTFRHLGLSRVLLGQLLDRKPPKPFIRALLMVALSLLIPSDDLAAYESHTVVNQSVLVCQTPKWHVFKGMVNACLRRFLRDKSTLLNEAKRSPVAQWNHPEWWIETLQKSYPLHWESILSVAQRPAPMTLRVNQRRITPLELKQTFTHHGIDSERVGEDGLVLAHARPVHDIPGFEAGWWSVQDAGAQLAARLLEIQPGMRVLDACAAPGGKTAHLLELYDIDLFALDISESRLSRIDQNLKRLGLKARLQAADAANTAAWWDGVLFDAVLADVPCTASGIVRRHPDIPWLRQQDDIKKTSQLQQHISDALWQVLKPQGQFLYVTCSVFPQEGEQQIQAFLSRHADAIRLPAPGQLLPTDTDAIEGPHDGFFYALLTKAGG